MKSSRRRFFQRTGMVAASVAGFPAVVRPEAVALGAPGARPRHIIFMVADGMSWGTYSLGEHFSWLLRQRGLRWLELRHRPGVQDAVVNMRSLNSLVTDSAAASSSWGSGSRVVNGALNQLPDGRELRPLYSLFGEQKWMRGLVTTTEITHATPAGFATNSSSRGTADAIAEQYLDRRIEVLLGGGRKFFEATKRKDKRDLFAAYQAAGYQVLRRAADLEAAPKGKPWLGTFAEGHLPYSIDRMSDASLMAKVPALARMTELALANLERADHFFLQVEGGRVDHGAHANDIAATLRDLVAFDEAVEVALEFQRRVPGTLLIVTTDHGTANPGLNGMGSGYAQSSPLFAHTLRVRRSFEAFGAELTKAQTVSGVQKILGEATGYKVPEAKAALWLELVGKKGRVLYDSMDAAELQLGQLMANHLGVGFTSGAHTADYVPLTALGPGAERFAGHRQNTEIFRECLQLAGIDYRNPEVPLMAEAGPEAGQVEGYVAWA